MSSNETRGRVHVESVESAGTHDFGLQYQVECLGGAQVISVTLFRKATDGTLTALLPGQALPRFRLTCSSNSSDDTPSAGAEIAFPQLRMLIKWSLETARQTFFDLEPAGRCGP